MVSKIASKNGGLIGWLGIKRQASSTPVLGERELAVLETLWNEQTEPALSAQQILEKLPNSTISLNTVQSTIERLHRKNVLLRKKQGRAYFYQAAISKSDIIHNLLSDITNELAQGDMSPMISGFLKFLSNETKENKQSVMDELKTLHAEPDIKTTDKSKD
ncbi:BlaI/MecI/CopY family transcriptional regulator [Colwellia echini]|uniref:BlaI/MecI/CopY family transcriptional regulator n=1 Tax=Colwellia echini TaxID=1982103 RepID=A0ABY3MV75_9GAMM|nr:BlaI/MecI/CopY family transcriptional regulator [Colwellia echini]TYK64992.1 BlaI/MecI/CopY family transcriptional regulator [Colwellia echini]